MSDGIWIEGTHWRAMRPGDGSRLAAALTGVEWAHAYTDEAHVERLISLGQSALVCDDAGSSDCTRALHGLLAVAPYPGGISPWQTVTMLAPCLQGRRLSALIKAEQWRIAQRMGINELVASVAVANGRSRAAMRKTYPTLRSQLVHEPWRPGGGRDSEIWLITGPPE